MDIESNSLENIDTKYRTQMKQILNNYESPVSSFSDTSCKIYQLLLSDLCTTDALNVLFKKQLSINVNEEFAQESHDQMAQFLCDLLQSHRWQDQRKGMIVQNILMMQLPKNLWKQHLERSIFVFCENMFKFVSNDEPAVRIEVLNNLPMLLQYFNTEQKQSIYEECQKQLRNIQQRGGNIVTAKDILSQISMDIQLISIENLSVLVKLEGGLSDTYEPLISYLDVYLRILQILINHNSQYFDREDTIQLLLMTTETSSLKLISLQILNKYLQKKSPYILQITNILASCLLDEQIEVRLEATLILKNLTPLPDDDQKEQLSDILFSLMFFNQQLDDDTLKAESKITCLQIFDINQQMQLMEKNLLQLINICVVQSYGNNFHLQKAAIHTIGRSLINQKDNPILKNIYQDLLVILLSIARSEENILYLQRCLSYLVHIPGILQDQMYISAVIDLGLNSFRVQNDKIRMSSIIQFINILLQNFDVIVQSLSTKAADINISQKYDFIDKISLVFIELYRRKPQSEQLIQILNIISKCLSDVQKQGQQDKSDQFKSEQWIKNMQLKDPREREQIKKYFEQTGLFELLLKDQKSNQNFIRLIEDHFGKQFIQIKLKNA